MRAVSPSRRLHTVTVRTCGRVERLTRFGRRDADAAADRIRRTGRLNGFRALVVSVRPL